MIYLLKLKNIYRNIVQYLYLQFGLEEGQVFAFGGDFVLDELGPNVRFDNVTFPHITNPLTKIIIITKYHQNWNIIPYLNIRQGTRSL